MTDTVKHMWDQVEKARADGTFSSEHAAVPAQDEQAWCQPMDSGKHTPRKFLLYFDDPDRGMAVFTDENEAREAFSKANTAWNCYLFGAMPLASRTPAETDKPVAWRYRWKIDGEWTSWRVSDASQKSQHLKDLEEVPLYETAPASPAACEQPDIDALAQFIRDAEREHGQCDDDDTYISYRPTARAILQKFDVRPKHSSTVGQPK